VTFIGNSTLQWNGSNTQDVSTSNGVAINAGVTATFDTNGNNVNLASSITTGAGSGITKIGAGTLTLGGANTYNGATTVANGTLQAGSATGFSSASAFTVASAGTLDVNGFAVTIGSLAGSGIVTNNGATAGALITGNDNTNTTFTGTLQGGSALSLTKAGTGTLTLGGGSTTPGEPLSRPASWSSPTVPRWAGAMSR